MSPKNKREVLEQELSREIERLCAKFKKETTLNVSQISVEMIDASDFRGDFYVPKVRVMAR